MIGWGTEVAVSRRRIAYNGMIDRIHLGKIGVHAHRQIRAPRARVASYDHLRRG